MTNASTSHGTLLQMGDGATPSETFATIAEVGDIPEVNRTARTAEVTSHSSAGWEEHIKTGVTGVPEFGVPINWVPTAPTHDDQTGLAAAFEDDDPRSFRIVLPGAQLALEFEALVVGFSTPFPVSGRLTATVRFQITGPVTINGGS